jgi:hypothetical protein
VTKHYSFKYRGNRQDVRWTREQMENHLKNMMKPSHLSSEMFDLNLYEIIEVTEKNLGRPKLETKVVF